MFTSPHCSHLSTAFCQELPEGASYERTTTLAELEAGASANARPQLAAFLGAVGLPKSGNRKRQVGRMRVALEGHYGVTAHPIIESLYLRGGGATASSGSKQEQEQESEVGSAVESEMESEAEVGEEEEVSAEEGGLGEVAEEEPLLPVDAMIASLSSLKYKELQQMLTDIGISSIGQKADLVTRLGHALRVIDKQKQREEAEAASKEEEDTVVDFRKLR